MFSLNSRKNLILGEKTNNLSYIVLALNVVFYGSYTVRGLYKLIPLSMTR